LNTDAHPVEKFEFALEGDGDGSVVIEEVKAYRMKSIWKK